MEDRVEILCDLASDLAMQNRLRFTIAIWRTTLKIPRASRIEWQMNLIPGIARSRSENYGFRIAHVVVWGAKHKKCKQLFGIVLGTGGGQT